MNNADKIKEMRGMAKQLIARVPDDEIVALRAAMDQAMASSRDAGLGPESAGAVAMFAISDMMSDDPTGKLMERILPGWGGMVALALIFEVFDPADPT